MTERHRKTVYELIEEIKAEHENVERLEILNLIQCQLYFSGTLTEWDNIPENKYTGKKYIGQGLEAVGYHVIDKTKTVIISVL